MVYTCPMHPEVTSPIPGNCPKCGMKLVIKGSEWKAYLPLVVIIAAILGVALFAASRSSGPFHLDLIEYFMAGFFIVFSALKLVDIKGFAEGYAQYDLLAKRWMTYGFLYPFIELGFGLSIVFGVRSVEILWAEFVVMAFSGIGVAVKIAKKEKFQCVCLGTFLKVPLTTVTLVEDLGMALLALVLILAR